LFTCAYIDWVISLSCPPPPPSPLPPWNFFCHLQWLNWISGHHDSLTIGQSRKGSLFHEYSRSVVTALAPLKGRVEGSYVAPSWWNSGNWGPLTGGEGTNILMVAASFLDTCHLAHKLQRYPQTGTQ
jgi:hypothetical protein